MTVRRIALVGPLPPPAGGMANQMAQLAALLRDEGLEVEVVRVNADYRPRWMARLRGLRAAARLLPYLVALWRTAGRVQLFHIMANSGWAWHLFAAPAIWIGRLRGVAVVVNYRGGEAEAFLARSSAIVGFSMRRAHALVVPTGFLKAVFGKYGMAADIVPNAVDLARFDGAARTRRGGGPHLLVARYLEPIYDNATALRTYALLCTRYPAATLTIAGSGPLLASLRALAQELGVADGVTFTGQLDHAAMAQQYLRADCLLNCSLVDNTPNSILEALASGVPVVSTNVGGVPYLVEDGRTALLVRPQSPQQMADAVARLVEEPRLRDELRAAGRALARQFSWPNVRPSLLEHYGRALQRARLPRPAVDGVREQPVRPPPAARRLLHYGLRRVAPGGDRGLSILIYHRVHAKPDPLFPEEPDRQRFARQLAMLRSAFTVLPLLDAVRLSRSGQLPPRAACITFDDGYADNADIALPLLQHHRLHATFFVASGFLDGGRMWNDSIIEIVRRAPGGLLDARSLGLGRYPLRNAAERRYALEALITQLKYRPLAERQHLTGRLAGLARVPLPDNLMMTTAQLRRLRDAGMHIGAHTVSHPILSRLAPAQARAEIADGRDALAHILQRDVRLFAYPNGKPGIDYLPEHVDMVRALGFDAAVTTAWGASAQPPDYYQLPRFTPWDRGRLRFLLRMARNLTVPAAAV